MTRRRAATVNAAALVVAMLAYLVAVLTVGPSWSSAQVTAGSVAVVLAMAAAVVPVVLTERDDR